MKLRPIQMLAVSAWALAACSGSTPSVEEIRIDPPEVAALDGCALAVEVSPGPLTQEQIERLWLRDRLALATCRGRHALLVEWARGTVASFPKR